MTSSLSSRWQGPRYFPHFANDPDGAIAIVVALRGLIDASILGWLTWRAETREQLIDRLTTEVWLLIDHHLREIGVRIDPAKPLPQSGQTQT